MTAPRNTVADFDVIIVGGGPVGAALAALLARQPGADPARLLLLDRDLPPPRATGEGTREPDLRVSALSRASERILTAAGAWPAIVAGGVSPYERMHIWPSDAEPRSEASLRFDAAELHEPNLGHIVENRLAQSCLLEAFRATGGRCVATSVTALEFLGQGVRVTTPQGSWVTRLVVGADGALSAVRRLAGLPTRVEDYGQLGVVARVRPERAHESTAWQRFLGHGTLALLPLASGECSIVWSLPRQLAEQRLQASPEEFNALLTEASQGVLGELQLCSARAAPPLRRIGAPSYAIERCALIGDAAHVVHPLAGQGVNLGLLDAAALADVIGAARAEGEDPGALRVLRRYERWRKGENEAMSAAFDAFNAFLSTGQGQAARIAGRGLGWVDRSALLKRLFIERAMGVAGELPAAAQRRA